MKSITAQLFFARFRSIWPAQTPIAGLSIAGLISLFLIGPVVPLAHADQELNRFGTPWVGEVTTDVAELRLEPSSNSSSTSHVAIGALVPVLASVEAGALWFQTPQGYVEATALREYREPWIGVIKPERIAIHAKPNAQSPVRRYARAGDFVRVTGMSPGVENDPNAWWATTVGYMKFQPDQLERAVPEQTRGWTMPPADGAVNGWWGSVTGPANVRVSPSLNAPIVGELEGGERTKVLSEAPSDTFEGNNRWFRIDGGRFAGAWVHSSLIKELASPQPTVTRPTTMPADRTWIVVDRGAGTLTLVRDGQPSFVTYVSLGIAGQQTPVGLNATIGKYRFDDMTSTSVPDPDDVYDLPNVPYAQYYRTGGFAIHGTYWHDQFGSPQSQGCINLTVTDAAYLFGQTTPVVRDDANERWANDQPATPVVIVD